MLHNVQELLKKLANEVLIEKFYFTGGTALSYYLNHRISYDIDFISESRLDSNKLKSLSVKYNAHFIPDPNISVFQINTGNNIDDFKMSFNFDGIKVEFFYLNDPISEEIIKKYKNNVKKIFNNLSILPIEAISSLKLIALFKRNKIRDLFDVFVLLDKDILDVRTIERFSAMYYDKTFVEFIEFFKDDGSESLDFVKENEYYEIFANSQAKLELTKEKLINKFVKKSLQ